MLIGELAAAAGVTSKTLRYYESEGLLHAARTPGGYRVYPPDTLDRIRFIRKAQAASLTLRQIGQILAIRDAGRAPCQHVAQLVDNRLDDIEERLRELHETRSHLRRLRKHLEQLDPAECVSRSVCSAICDT